MIRIPHLKKKKGKKKSIERSELLLLRRILSTPIQISRDLIGGLFHSTCGRMQQHAAARRSAPQDAAGCRDRGAHTTHNDGDNSALINGVPIPFIFPWT